MIRSIISLSRVDDLHNQLVMTKNYTEENVEIFVILFDNKINYPEMRRFLTLLKNNETFIKIYENFKQYDVIKIGYKLNDEIYFNLIVMETKEIFSFGNIFNEKSISINKEKLNNILVLV